jgi:hypothetical protein
VRVTEFTPAVRADQAIAPGWFQPLPPPSGRYESTLQIKAKNLILSLIFLFSMVVSARLVLLQLLHTPTKTLNKTKKRLFVVLFFFSKTVLFTSG